MKIILASVLLGLLVVCVASTDDEYTTKYDNINLTEILQSRRLMGNYVDCCLDKIPCTKDGLELKSHIKDALETGCSKCSEKQKKGIRKVAKHLRKNEPGWWKALADKYDPKHQFETKYAEWIKEIDAEPL